MRYRLRRVGYRPPRSHVRWVGSKVAGAGQALQGSSDGLSGTTGNLNVSYKIAGTSAAQSATTGALSVTHALAGASGATSTTTGALTVTGPTLFATSVSANKRYLLDQFGDPYFFQGNSPQNMVPNGTLADMEDFFVDQQARGFNSAQVHLVYNYDADAETSTTPFSSNSTMATAGHTAYWGTVDSMFDLAETYGFTLWATVLDNISCGATVAAATDANCFAYGQFLGARYKTRPNLVWTIGNDFDTTQWTARNPKYKKIIDGIKDQGDTHLITLWNNTVSSDSNTGFDLYYDIDLCYEYFHPPYTQGDVAYSLSRTGFPKPWFWGEGTYYGELNANPGPPSSTDLDLRKEAWWTITWGGCGHFFGTHQVWLFGTWQTEAAGAAIYDQLAHIPTEFAGLNGWQDLVPDQSHVFQTGGRNTFNGGNHQTDTFSTAAFINGGALAVAYFPTSRGSITFDTTKLNGTVSAYWLDPVDGSHHAESNPAAPTHPGTNSGGVNADWALVFLGEVVIPMAGTSAGQSATTGDLAVAHALAGTTAGVSATTGALAVAHSLAGTVTATSATTGDLAVSHALAGTSGAISSTSGDLFVSTPLAGSSDAVSTTTGAMAVAHSLAGSSDAVSTTTGAIVVARALAGQVDTQSATTGALGVDHGLAGTVTGQSATTGALVVAHSLVGTSAGQSATSGDMTLLQGRTITPAAGTWTAIALTASGVGTTSGTITPAMAAWTARDLGGSTAGRAQILSAEAHWTAVPLTATGVGTVTGTLTPAVSDWTAIPLTGSGVLISGTLIPAEATWSAAVLTGAGGAFAGSILPATATWSAVALSGRGINAVVRSITPAMAAWTASPLGAFGQGIVIGFMPTATGAWTAVQISGLNKPVDVGTDPVVDCFVVCLDDGSFCVVVTPDQLDGIDEFCVLVVTC